MYKESAHRIGLQYSLPRSESPRIRSRIRRGRARFSLIFGNQPTTYRFDLSRNRRSGLEQEKRRSSGRSGAHSPDAELPAEQGRSRPPSPSSPLSPAHPFLPRVWARPSPSLPDRTHLLCARRPWPPSSRAARCTALPLMVVVAAGFPTPMGSSFFIPMARSSSILNPNPRQKPNPLLIPNSMCLFADVFFLSNSRSIDWSEDQWIRGWIPSSSSSRQIQGN